MDEVKQLARSLDIIAARCPHGLAAIVGDAPRPSDAEIITAATWCPSSDGSSRSGVSAEGPVPSAALKVAEITAALDNAGWRAIVAAGREVRNLFPQDWEAYRLHVTYISAPVEWRMNDESTLEKIAKRCGMDVRTVQRRRRQVPYQIARAALLGVQQSINFNESKNERVADVSPIVPLIMRV